MARKAARWTHGSKPGAAASKLPAPMPVGPRLLPLPTPVPLAPPEPKPGLKVPVVAPPPAAGVVPAVVIPAELHSASTVTGTNNSVVSLCTWHLMGNLMEGTNKEAARRK
jgi:hypothetical protein